MAGEGTLFRKKSTGKWYFIYYLGEKTEDGRYKQKWYDLETTDWNEAKKRRDDIKANFTKKGRHDEPSKELFGKWLDFWLNEIQKPNIKPKTYDDYEYIIRIHIKPCLGITRLKDISPEIVLAFYNQKRNEKRLSRKLDKNKTRIPSDETLSLRTLQKIQYIMNSALESARKMRKIPENPIDFLEKSTRANYNPPESPYMDSEEIINFLESISSDKWFSTFVTVLGTGLRLGELTGLKWEKVDLERGIIEVDETRQIIKNHSGEDQKTKLIIGTPKSKKSKRYLPLPIDVVEVLKNLKNQQAEEKTKLKKDYLGDGVKHDLKQEQWFVFTWEDGRTIRPDYLSKHFKKLIRKFGREDMTFHKLRHSYATMLLEMGEEMKTIQENLGHAQLSTTSGIYTHILERMKARAARKLDGFTKRKAN